MFDVEKITKLGTSVISLDGNTVYTDHKIEDDKTKQEAKISSLIYEEALYEFTRLAVSNPTTFEDVCNNMIANYGLNGEVTASPINRAIASILSDEEMTIRLDTDLANSPYSFLARTEKGRAQALLRHRALLLGFDIENLNINYDESNRVVKVSYKKVMLYKEGIHSKPLFDMTPEEKLDHAQKRLAEAISSGEKEMEVYYREYINTIKSKYKLDSDRPFEIVQGPTSGEVTPKQEQRSSATWNVSTAEKMLHANIQLSNALESKDEESANHWQDAIEDIMDKRVHPFENEIKNFYSSFQEAFKRGEIGIAKLYAEQARKLITQHPITVTPDKWGSFSGEEKIRYTYLLVIESAVFERKEAFEYWKGEHKKLQLQFANDKK